MQLSLYFKLSIIYAADAVWLEENATVALFVSIEACKEFRVRINKKKTITAVI